METSSQSSRAPLQAQRPTAFCPMEVHSMLPRQLSQPLCPSLARSPKTGTILCSRTTTQPLHLALCLPHHLATLSPRLSTWRVLSATLCYLIRMSRQASPQAMQLKLLRLVPSRPRPARIQLPVRVTSAGGSPLVRLLGGQEGLDPLVGGPTPTKPPRESHQPSLVASQSPERIVAVQALAPTAALW